MPGADRLSLLDAARARRRRRDRGRLRLGVPLRRRPGPGARRPRPRPWSPTSAPPARRSRPSMRLGWLVAPPALHRAILDAPRRSPTTAPPGRCSVPSSSLLRDGYVDQVVRSARRTYADAGRAGRGRARGRTPSRSGPSPGCTRPSPLPQADAPARAADSARAAGFEVPLLRDYCRTRPADRPDHRLRRLHRRRARPGPRRDRPRTRLTRPAQEPAARRRTRRTPRPARARSCDRGSTPCPTAARRSPPSTNIIGTTNPRPIAATWITQPDGVRPLPAQHAGQQQAGDAEAEPDGDAPSATATSARLIITGVVRPSVIASRDRIAAHMPRLRRALAVGRLAIRRAARAGGASPGPRRR